MPGSLEFQPAVDFASRPGPTLLFWASVSPERTQCHSSLVTRMNGCQAPWGTAGLRAALHLAEPQVWKWRLTHTDAKAGRERATVALAAAGEWGPAVGDQGEMGRLSGEVQFEQHLEDLVRPKLGGHFGQRAQHKPSPAGRGPGASAGGQGTWCFEVGEKGRRKNSERQRSNWRPPKLH